MRADNRNMWHAKITARQEKAEVGGSNQNASGQQGPVDAENRPVLRTSEQHYGGAEYKKRNPAGGPGFERGYSHDSFDNGSPHRPSPAIRSVRASILRALLEGRSLTSAEAWREYGASRLAADIYELKRMGWGIASCTVEVAVRGSRTARVASYYFPTNVLEQIRGEAKE